jgi:phage gp29-like protein
VVQSGGGVITDLPLYQQFSRIGGNITPVQVSNILLQADAGDPRRLVDLSNECRQRDGHLHGVLRTRIRALDGLELQITPWKDRGREEPLKRDVKIADFVQDALDGATGDGRDYESFDELISRLNSAIYYGYSVCETDWRLEGNTLLPKGFKYIDPRRFIFGQSDGRLQFSDAWGAMSGIDLQEQFPGSFLQHQPMINGDVAAREGLNKLMVWFALFRNWSISDWLQLAEMTWKPYRIGKYPRETAGQNLTSTGVAAIRDDWELLLMTASGQSSGSTGKGPHQQLCEFSGAEISKAALGQTLTTEAGDRGARSLGEVHDRVRKDIRDSDARAVAATIRRDLVAWIVLVNYGPIANVPGVGFATDDTEDISTFAEGMKTLREAGHVVQQSWIRDKIGQPEPTEGEPVLGDPLWEVEVDTSDLEDDPSTPTDPDTEPEEELEEAA